ncbi:MAG: protein kinase [Candidatus Methanosuratincola sp.]
MDGTSKTLGKYQIIREIARSNDIVYEAYDPVMNRRVALKELYFPPGVTEKQRQDRFARFMREAKAAGSLAHPNIVTVYEVGEDQGRYYIAMEYLEGQTLRQRLDAEGKLPQEEAVKILIEVLKGLEYAHQHGVIHRDIKPENIQLLPDGRVKITDFGIARLTFEPSLTIDGQIFGTPSYMSPEQVYGRDIDARSDIFSCGIVLYQALKGEKPFQGDSVVTISHAILHYDPPDPPHVSYPIAQIVKKALEKSPEHRFPSAGAMAKALEEALSALKQDPYLAPHPTHPGYPYGQPYDPYSQTSQPTPPHGSPYGHPYSPQPDPYSYPYSPAPSPDPNANTPHPLPPNWAFPAQRPPLLSPAAKEFLGKTLLVALIGSAFVTLGFSIISALLTAAERQQRYFLEAKEYGKELETAKQLSHTQPDEAIKELERLREILTSPDLKKEAENTLAVLTLERAKQHEARGEWILALQEYDRATTLIPHDPMPLIGKARCLSQLASRSRSPEERITHLKNSADAYQSAFTKRIYLGDNFRKEAAQVFLKLAREHWAYGQLLEAEQALRRAQNIAPQNSQEYREAERELKNLSARNP